MAISSEEGVNLCDGQRENQRWTRQQVERLQVIQSSPLSTTLFRYSPVPLRRWLLRDRPHSNKSPRKQEKPLAQASMSDDLKQQICDKTRLGNRRRMERWKLPREGSTLGGERKKRPPRDCSTRR